jgi:hypothetical protein
VKDLPTLLVVTNNVNIFVYCVVVLYEYVSHQTAVVKVFVCIIAVVEVVPTLIILSELVILSVLLVVRYEYNAVTVCDVTVVVTVLAIDVPVVIVPV